MRPGRNSYWIGIFLAFMFAGINGCDTERNVEDPDLHYFVKYYGGDGDQQGVDMLEMNDGSFLLLGNSATIDSNNGVFNGVYLVRVNGEGKILWEKEYNEATNSYAKDIELAIDGNLVVLCDVETAVSGRQFKLMKISPDGDVLDNVTQGTTANDFSRTVTPVEDGGFIVSGTTEATLSPETDPGDTFSYRFDQNLDDVPNWGPVVLGFTDPQSTDRSLMDVAVKSVELPDGTIGDPDGEHDGFYVIGHTKSNISNTNPNGKLGLFCFRRSKDGTTGGVMYPGNIVNVNDTEIHFVQEVAPALGTGYVVIGSSQNNTGLSEIFIARLRKSLTFGNTPFIDDITLYKTLSVNRNVRGVSGASSVLGAAGFLVLGNEVRTTGATNIWISKIDQSGNILWSSTFGSEEGQDTAAAVKELPDGKIVILGTMGLADNQSKMALIKVNPTGQLLK